MVYQNKLVAAIKVAGQILRETSNVVTLPFGSEYSVFLKNLNSVRVLAKVSVDGKDATEGTWLIIQPNSDLELERFIRDGNFERGNRFKFIERTAQIEKHRGIGAEDGIVRVEYKTERVEPIIRQHYYDEWVPVPRPYYPPRPLPRRPGEPWDRRRRVHMGAVAMRSLRASASPRREVKMRFGEVGPAQAAGNDAGITVAGSESNQRFVSGEWFPTEAQSEVIVLQLRGEVSGKRVAQAVTVKTKPQCSTCGKVNKGGMTFCGSCGTALNLW